MDRSQEKALEQTFTNIIGVPAKATLEGEHLNTTYGYIGAEQHLMRFPGDTMATHPKLAEKDEGMAPGRGLGDMFPTKMKNGMRLFKHFIFPIGIHVLNI